MTERSLLKWIYNFQQEIEKVESLLISGPYVLVCPGQSTIYSYVIKKDLSLFEWCVCVCVLIKPLRIGVWSLMDGLEYSSESALKQTWN